MKTNYVRILAGLAIIAVIGFISGCDVDSSNKEEAALDAEMQTYIDQKIQDRVYVADISLSPEFFGTNMSEIQPEDIPEIYDRYTLTVYKDEKKAKLEWYQHEELDINDQSLNKIIAQSVITYLAIEEDTVSVYIPSESGYQLKKYENQELVDSLNKVLFLEDSSIFDGMRLVTGYQSGIDDPPLQVERQISSAPFYLPFYLLTEQPIQQQNSFYVVFKHNNNGKLSIIDFQKRDLYVFAYECVTGIKYENIYTQRDLPYEINLMIDFADPATAVDFEVPTVK